MSFGISADCAADAFALTNRCQTCAHWCLARILTSGGVPERCPQCLQKRSSGQPRGNSFQKERSLPLVLHLVVAKSVNSVSAFGAKSSVHFLAPPLPTKPATLGFGGAPIGVRSNTVGSPLGGLVRWKMEGAVQNPPLSRHRKALEGFPPISFLYYIMPRNPA